MLSNFDQNTIMSALDRTERLLPADAAYLEYHGGIPIFHEETLLLATWNPEPDPHFLDDIALTFGIQPIVVRAEEVTLRAAIQKLYGVQRQSAGALAAEMSSHGSIADPVAIDDLRAQANEAPVIGLVNALLLEALEAGASDIHLESMSAGLQIRYRLDGVLSNATQPPPHLAAAVISRIKIMAELDIAERRLPQDGRIRLRLDGGSVDVRVATLPSLHGESIVLRLLDKRRQQTTIGKLGMAAHVRTAFEGLIGEANGLVLVTGPTGSGKTTTLYAALNALNSGDQKIITVEDPVEYEIAGVVQVSVNAKVGLTFAGSLRALLRQDPDIMLIGEIRDGETADIAVHAALTGHLVLATLHTNDAPSAVPRLVDLGVPPFLVKNTLRGVVAQRLVRRNCEACSVSYEASRELIARLSLACGHVTLKRGAGCTKCRWTGFLGRLPIFELLTYGKAGSQDTIADITPVETLLQDGSRLVAAGYTTPEEVLRVVQ
jgi:type II secretory ATPase GspE/PulE/Tfp pilus assembly ATPase PilB-like protein